MSVAINELIEFIKMNCIKYNIDESHGLKHSLGTIAWAEKLMNGIGDISNDERRMIIYAASLHDMCDSKYRNVEEACDEICAWLQGLGWCENMASTLISIITSMSYSKLKKSFVSGEKYIYPNHGPWQRAYHIVRHADLLEAYRVVRCFLYSQRCHPDWSDDELWQETHKVFDERVFNYVQDGWIFLDSALVFIPALEAEARRCLQMRDTTYLI